MRLCSRVKTEIVVCGYTHARGEVQTGVIKLCQQKNANDVNWLPVNTNERRVRQTGSGQDTRNLFCILCIIMA